jgi:hypothetical protein
MSQRSIVRELQLVTIMLMTKDKPLALETLTISRHTFSEQQGNQPKAQKDADVLKLQSGLKLMEIGLQQQEKRNFVTKHSLINIEHFYEPSTMVRNGPKTRGI